MCLSIVALAIATALAVSEPTGKDVAKATTPLKKSKPKGTETKAVDKKKTRMGKHKTDKKKGTAVYPAGEKTEHKAGYRDDKKAKTESVKVETKDVKTVGEKNEGTCTIQAMPLSVATVLAGIR